ncbi:hypothetical protein [Catenuloplanes japonicus]|uniref:hypothetical protein n=1 Tax=Catenuloplanes japonicus TaxID=33876 RepID=UPI0005248295|nr:hypothetical protein [Catenuloplanes japonicus]
MSVTQIRIFAVAAAIAAALFRLAAEPLTPSDDAAWSPAGITFILLFLGSMAGPLAAYAILTGPARRRPESLRAGTAPGTLIAPARLLGPGSQLILGAWLVTNLFLANPDQQSWADVRLAWLSRVLAVVVLLMGVTYTFLVRPRPHLLLDANGVTIHPWFPRRTTRVLWDDLHPAEPVRTTGDPVGRVHLTHAVGGSVTVLAEHLDVEPAYLARVMTDLATAPDRRAFIDKHLLLV